MAATHDPTAEVMETNGNESSLFLRNCVWSDTFPDNIEQTKILPLTTRDHRRNYLVGNKVNLPMTATHNVNADQAEIGDNDLGDNDPKYQLGGTHEDMHPISKRPNYMQLEAHLNQHCMPTGPLDSCAKFRIENYRRQMQLQKLPQELAKPVKPIEGWSQRERKRAAEEARRWSRNLGQQRGWWRRC